MAKSKILPPAELELFFSNLELVYHSGLPLAEGFDILRANALSPKAQARMQALHQAALAGESLHKALAKGGELPRYALALIGIGEQTGRMEQTFKALAEYYQKRDLLAQSIRSALTYPLSMLVVVVAVVVILLTQVMPVFNQVFEQLGFQMTGLAAGLLAAGSAIGAVAPWIIGVLALLVVAVLLLRRTRGGRRFFGRLYQNAPVTRELSFSTSAQRFAIALSTLLEAGLDVDQALGLAEPLLEDRRARQRVVRIRKQVESGEPFIQAIEKSGLFPREAMSLLAVGFKTGADAEALAQVGAQIAAATEAKVERLVAAIEPTLVAVMCVLVGLILLSVMLPLLGVLTGI